jgi:hypothetical protein
MGIYQVASHTSLAVAVLHCTSCTAKPAVLQLHCQHIYLLRCCSDRGGAQCIVCDTDSVDKKQSGEARGSNPRVTLTLDLKSLEDNHESGRGDQST